MHRFPNDKRFAFTIFDDTDLSTVSNIRPVYDLLSQLNLRTTKSVWPLASVPDGWHGGSSLQEPEYLRFIHELSRRGFEIALHNVRNHDATRDIVHHGLEEFRRLIGHYPRVHANHSRNRDNIYWGKARLNRLPLLYSACSALRQSSGAFEGHDPNTRYFWGDLCRERVDYVRNFVFPEINLDNVNPTMPYYDPRRPFVKHWFSSADGANVSSFCEMLSEPNQDRLEAEGGVCIIYTHLACGFVSNGAVDARAETLLRRMAVRDGWFVPVATLLDFLRTERSSAVIPVQELRSMELQWAIHRFKQAITRRWHAAHSTNVTPSLSHVHG